MKPGLYIIATPIGNMADLTFRALETLKMVDLVACEDTRVTQKLFARYEIKTPVISYFEHNAQKMIPKIISRIEEGLAVGLVSSAGTPLISDPGFKLVNKILEKELYVTTIPGASAVISALTLSGIATDRFMFAGFLPTKTKARQTFLAELKDLSATLIFFESPKRLQNCLKDLAEVLGERPAAVIREITKIYEEIHQDTLTGLVQYYAQSSELKGEIVIVVARAETVTVSNHQLEAFLKTCLTKKLSLKDAVQLASFFGYSKKELYQQALVLKEK